MFGKERPEICEAVDGGGMTAAATQREGKGIALRMRKGVDLKDEI